ncbi:hypothetical protein TNIN_27741 [Trichonephila inaurata madagascariensis]|uniref:Uncharacterized protein n=1 Tax=Trichonephila inaurata madagascariensis TaxID=2747483 RepID=A0A8X7CM43_9ARAC|nr:hypothetical protein TNIN_27741 [Trichonephila inaurata madagascariensis]
MGRIRNLIRWLLLEWENQKQHSKWNKISLLYCSILNARKRCCFCTSGEILSESRAELLNVEADRFYLYGRDKNVSIVSLNFFSRILVRFRASTRKEIHCRNQTVYVKLHIAN